MANYLVRGILIGGSLGVVASFFGIVEMSRGAILGATAGGFAGWTMESKQQRKRDAERRDDDSGSGSDED